MFLTISSFKLAITVDNRQHISLYMPLRVSAGTLQNVTAICFMSTLTECNADTLRFFTSN